MSSRDFPFRPPPLVATEPLRWVLARAFGPAGCAPGPVAGAAAAELAERLGLAARILARGDADALAAELGPGALARLRDERRALAARQLRHEAALALFSTAAAALEVPFAPLKGGALTLGGWSLAATRPASDLDLLVPGDRLEELQRDLLRRGFMVTGTAYEHQAPMLRHPAGGQLELHRVVLGVRLARRRSADFDALARAGLLDGRPPAPTVADRRLLRWPGREVLAAHAIVHALAQHVLAPGAYSGLLLVGDLVDLGAVGAPGRELLETVRPWIRAAVPGRVSLAAFDLVDSLAAGEPPAPGDAECLLAHFVLGATDPRYQAALRARWLERPLSDRSRTIARLALLRRTLVPPRRPGPGGEPEAWRAWTLRLARRPFELARSWRAARRARRPAPPDDPGPGARRPD